MVHNVVGEIAGMKKIKELLEKRWAAYSVATCSAVILYLLLSHLTGPVAEWVQSVFKMLSPIVVGIVIAYLLNPLVNFFEQRVFHKIANEKIRHILSVVLALVSALLVVALLLILLVPALVESVSTIINSADQYKETAETLIASLSERFGGSADLDSLLEDLDKWVDKLLAILTDNMGTILSKLTNFGSSLVNTGLGVVLAIYFLVDKKNILQGINKLRKACMTDKSYQKQTVFLERCHGVFLQYILYSLLDALIVGASNAIFMACMRMPYIPLVSVIVGVTNLLPTFGPIIGAVVGAVVLVFDRPILALWFLIFTAVIQTLDANVIKPKLFHDSLGLPAVMTLISIIIGGKLFGTVGIFLAIPVTVVLRFLYNENFLPWMERNKRRRETLRMELRNSAEEDSIKEELTEEVVKEGNDLAGIDLEELIQEEKSDEYIAGSNHESRNQKRTKKRNNRNRK